MFIEIHMIQNFAPSNLNRDDTNNPKDCLFGGVRRARVSSQCLKRSIRLAPVFSETTMVPVSHRTKLLASELQAALIKKGLEEEAALAKAQCFANFYSSQTGKSDKGKTVVMLFVSPQEIDEISSLLLDLEDEKAISEAAKNYGKQNSKRAGTPDIALFGRMVADQPTINVDAACQIAHAISTHAVTMDLDFFTAVDDLLKEGETGAGMMGSSGFNSACFYRYSCIDFDQLVNNLSGDKDLAKRTVEAFLKASAYSVPSGKQHSYAANNPPSFMMAVVRDNGMCCSLANAFEKPVYVNPKTSLIRGSVEALDHYWGRLNAFYGGDPFVCVAAVDDQLDLNSLNSFQVESFQVWINTVIEHLPKG